jgi:hypothetical protein
MVLLKCAEFAFSLCFWLMFDFVDFGLWFLLLVFSLW